MNPFFQKLTLPLLKNIFKLKEQTSKSAEHLLNMRLPSGAWGGRLGAEDLYYTRFAVRGLELCGKANTQNLQPVAKWIADIKLNDAIDCFCLIDIITLLRENKIECEHNFTDASKDITLKLNEFNLQNDNINIPGKSIYHTFLARLAVDMCYDDIVPANHAEVLSDASICDLLISRQSEGGGFADSSANDLTQTNPTAAAAGLAGVCKNIPPELTDNICAYLANTQRDDGGFGASAKSKSGDLLSTFTALAGLFMHKRLKNIRLGDAGRFIKSCRKPDGSFSAFPEDPETDAEYIYYGLGSLAILSARLVGKRLS